MAKLPDEVLMRYADGALSAQWREEVEAALQTDADARLRLEAFRATGRRLSTLYGKPMDEPVPERLKDFVLNFPLGEEGPPQAEVQAKAKRFGTTLADTLNKLALKAQPVMDGAAAWLEVRTHPLARWQLAAASAALITLSASAGWLVHGDAEPAGLVSFEDGRVYASGAFQRVLEELPSNQDVNIAGARASDAVTMRANLTFKSKEGSWCRAYEILAKRTGRHVGLGCREPNGKWVMEVHVPKGGVRKEQQPTVPAGTGQQLPDKQLGKDRTAELDAVLDRVQGDDALGREAEDAVIAGHWKQ